MIKFGTDGWRDIMNDQFTLEPVRRVVQAIADHVHAHGGDARGLIMGYDARFFSDRFASEAAGVLAANGIKVFILPRDLPTPVVAFAVRHAKAFGALMFTASHNPAEYNGIKFIPEYAGPASLEITGEIERFLAQPAAGAGVRPGISPEEAERRCLRQPIDPVPAYLSHLGTLVDRQAIAEAGLTLFIDPMHGSGRGILRDFLGESCRVEEIHPQRDPLFGGKMPDPQEANLEELKAKVREAPGRLGLGMDGDADRFGIVDSDGTYIAPNQVIALLLYHLVHSRHWTGIAGRSVATTHLIDAVGASFGLETVETPVGFKYIGELMRTRPVIIGGEESGGLSIRGHIPEKDGLLACALMAEMRAMTGEPLGATLAGLRRQFGGFYTRRLDLHLETETKNEIIRSFNNDPPSRVLGQEVVELRRLDGIKCIMADGSWFLLRPSGTEALVRAYIEAPDPQRLQALGDWLQQRIDSHESKTSG